MRDFRDAKAMARTLRQALAAKGVKISQGEALELIARVLGERDWNTLAATIEAEAQKPEAPKSEPETRKSEPEPARPPTPPVRPRSAGSQRFTPALEQSLHRAVAEANQRRHEYTTLEHLLLALLDSPEAAEVLLACAADLDVLRSGLLGFIDQELGSLITDSGEPVRPTAGFHRVIQRAVIHVQSAGRDQVTGANVLVAIFSERESRAAHLLAQQGIDRYDAVNFIAHGVRKDGGKAA
jgi:hypothetical protein